MWNVFICASARCLVWISAIRMRVWQTLQYSSSWIHNFHLIKEIMHSDYSAISKLQQQWPQQKTKLSYKVFFTFKSYRIKWQKSRLLPITTSDIIPKLIRARRTHTLFPPIPNEWAMHKFGAQQISTKARITIWLFEICIRIKCYILSRDGITCSISFHIILVYQFYVRLPYREYWFIEFFGLRRRILWALCIFIMWKWCVTMTRIACTDTDATRARPRRKSRQHKMANLYSIDSNLTDWTGK